MIKPVVFKKTLEGKSNANLITFSDGRDYVVKFFSKDLKKLWQMSGLLIAWRDTLGCLSLTLD